MGSSIFWIYIILRLWFQNIFLVWQLSQSISDISVMELKMLQIQFSEVVETGLFFHWWEATVKVHAKTLIMSLFIIILSSKCQLVNPACNGRVGLLLSAIHIFYPHPLVRWKDCCDGISFEVGSDGVNMKATLSKFSLL